MKAHLGSTSHVAAVLFIGVALVTSPVTATDFLDIGEAPSECFHPQRLLVRFEATAGRATRIAVHDAAQVEGVLREYHGVNGLQLVAVREEVLPTALAIYRSHPEIRYAERDYAIQLHIAPNDPDFGQLWGLFNGGQTVDGDPGTLGADIRAVDAWDIWTGDADFRIAVIDTGIDYNHPDLQGNIWTNYAELNGITGVDDDGNGYVDDIHGYNFYDDNGDPMDGHGHGTHVAGTIGALANNGLGVAGVNWQCQIVAVRFASDFGSAYVSDAVEAFQYVIDNGIRASNNSWGVICPLQEQDECDSLRDIIEASQAVGHVAVAAAGNGDYWFSNPQNNDVVANYPATFDLPNIIAVAATNNDDGKAAFSNYGPTTVDLGAPGVNIYSTWPPFHYVHADGTSMAAAHVTGVVGLVMSRSPQLTGEQVKERILLTARPVASLAGITVTGGVVNAQAAIGDCNDNGILDDQDVAVGASPDCNMNGIPDECEVFDCNDNGVPDSCDLADWTSQDCNGNGVPDECEPDCNGNGVADGCDLTGGASDDCNVNGIPDECELGWDEDCNGNGEPDLCDMHAGSNRDCNGNNVPDECDVADGTLHDANGDGLADECVFGLSFVPVDATGDFTIEDGRIILEEPGQRVGLEIRLSGWDVNLDGMPLLGLYQATIDSSGFTDGLNGSVTFAQIPCTVDDDCEGGSVASGNCPAGGYCGIQTALFVDESRRDFVYYGLRAITGTFDSGSTGTVGGLLWDEVDGVADPGVTTYAATLLLDVSPDAMGTFTVAFKTNDDADGGVEHHTFIADPDGVRIPLLGRHAAFITIISDCNDNGVADHQDVAEGTSADCNGNWNPDECEPDCNGNAIPDSCDIAEGTSADCNGNGIPDECFFDETDCNGNFFPDLCDLANGTSADCNGNGVPDECEADCDGDSIPDTCEIWVQQTRLLAPDPAPNTYFGSSVAVDGELIVVGAHTDDGAENASGSAYVFLVESGSRAESGKLVASDGATWDSFGEAVAVHGDTVVVGATHDDDDGSDSGSAYVFQWEGSDWIEYAKLTTSDAQPGDRFGGSVAIDEDTVVVGAARDDDAGGGSGSVYVFQCEDGDCYEEGKLTAADAMGGDNFGWGLAIDAGTIVVGAAQDDDNGSNSGSAYVFGRNLHGFWVQEGKLIASDAWADDQFGYSVGIEGNTVVVGAPKDGDGGQTSGAAYVFTRDFNGAWSQEAKLTASDAGPYDQFGLQVAISGDTIVVGAAYHDDVENGPGAAYMFVRDSSGVWTHEAKLTASDGAAGDLFGYAVAIKGDVTVVGARRALDTRGAAYVYRDHDCNRNAFPDSCDVDGGDSADDNVNGIPDECEIDVDVDGVADLFDNCPVVANPEQEDTDIDGVGDLCDNCGSDPNPGQEDQDDDGVGDACEDCPFDANKIEPGVCGCGLDDNADSDQDAVPDCIDLCPGAEDGLFAPGCAAAIPTVSEWGLVVLALLLLTAGKLRFGRYARMGAQPRRHAG